MSSESEKTIGSGPITQSILRMLALACATSALFGAVTEASSLGASNRGPTPISAPALASIAGRPPRSGSHPRPIEPPPPSRERLLPLTGHIVIPAIAVDAPLIPLGVASDGTLEVPGDWGVAGWFTGGPFPGEPGPAVVVGHVDSTQGPAVFYRLRELDRGDMIVLWRRGGSRSRFRVTSLQRVSKSAFPTQRVYGSLASPVLRLITCGGAFDRSSGRYVDNLIVYAVDSS